LLAAAAALLIAAALGWSSAHAMLLGDAVVRSEPGAPLRVVIPLKPTPGEALEAACFRLVSFGGSTSMVTAKVSLERAAATPRLVVTTQQPIAEPVVRFAIDASCDGTLRRNYALKLDSGGVTSGIQTITANSAHGPGQERLETVQAATVSVADAAPVEPARSSAKEPQTTPVGASGRERPLTAAAVLGRAATAPRTPEPARGLGVGAGDSSDLIWYLGAALGMAALALGVLLFARRGAAPTLPDWTRGGEYTGPRSRTDMSAQPVTLSHEDGFTPMPKLSTTQRPDGASLGVVKSALAANSLRRQQAYDLSTLDTLIGDMSEEDRQEDRAVREAWAAARNAVEGEEDNEILRAINEAERELLLVPPRPTDASHERSFEEDLASPARPSDKAAA
jgi:hypothetical protein